VQLTKDLYQHSLALLTDLYQLTMAYGYWKNGMAEKEGVFNLFFRQNPFNGGFTINCGLEYAVNYLKNFRFAQDDIDYLKTIKASDGSDMFSEEFLKYLRKMEFSCDVDAMPEGTAVFPHQPLMRVKGPLLQCQLLETPLLNLINFQTLIATKAARIHLASKGQPVMEFGLRRAHGIDGGIAASRAAYIGGTSSTSNVLAGKLFDIPVAGTHAHSWVMSFPSELDAFESYAKALPNNSIFLVDTYDTIQGIKHAIEVGEMLKKNGHKMLGIRIDSGDLAYFSIKARKLLDEAGFEDANIVASNDLDENIIASLKEQDAEIDLWGIGTKLVTAFDQPALGGVYKLAAIRNDDGDWEHTIKLSEQTVKINNPGIQQVRRFYQNHKFGADMIYDKLLGLGEKHIIIDPTDPTRRKSIDPKGSQWEDLLKPVFEQGECTYELPKIKDIRERTIDQLSMLDKSIKRFVHPHIYPVGLERQLHEKKTKLIFELRRIQD